MIGPDLAREAGRGRRAALPDISPARPSWPRPARSAGRSRNIIAAGQHAAGATVAADATGVALRCLKSRGGFLFQIVLLKAEHETGVLFEAKDDRDVVAVWRRMAEDLGLPAVVLTLDGSIIAFNAMLGRLAVGAVRPRRRNAILARRRPRLLMRRRTGRLPQRPSIHREREIIARGD